MARKKGAVVTAKSEDTKSENEDVKSETDNPAGDVAANAEQPSESDLSKGDESTMDKEIGSSEAVKDQAPEVKAKKVKNIARAGQTVFGVTGAPVIFNSEGIAEGAAADLEYLLTVPGYEGV